MSETTERQFRLLNVLSRRRHDTVGNLAAEFGVSERTIRRDIDVLSTIAPIYTQSGRYFGGVYMIDGYYTNRVYLTAEQERVLKYIVECIKLNKRPILTNSETDSISEVIKTYSLP